MLSKKTIQSVLSDAFKPFHLEVIDESYKHAGHSEEAKAGGTHYQVLVVSNAFEGKKLIERHRMVYEAIKAAGVYYHALAINAKTQTEYSA